MMSHEFYDSLRRLLCAIFQFFTRNSQSTSEAIVDEEVMK